MRRQFDHVGRLFRKRSSILPSAMFVMCLRVVKHRVRRLMVLTRRNGEGRLEVTIFTRKGKGHAKSNTNLYEGIQTGSSATRAVKWKIAGPNCARPGYC